MRQATAMGVATVALVAAAGVSLAATGVLPPEGLALRAGGPSSGATAAVSAGSMPTSTQASVSGTPGATATPTPDATAACVERAARAMSTRQRVGQLFMVGVPSTGSGPSLRRLLAKEQPGSLLLMGRTTAGVDQVAARVTRMTAAAGAPAGARPVVAVDQEGGRVRRLSGPGFAAMPAAADQAGWSADELTSRSRRWGRDLSRAGVTLDLAPVADVVPASVGEDNEPVAALDRGFGSDPAAVSADVTAVVRGLRAGGVDTAVKHFPGLGRVRGNTDFSSGVVDRVTRRHDRLLAPFAAGVRAGSGWLMVSLATYPKIDPDHRAAFSPTVVDGLVRRDLGFEGVVVSDDLGVAAEVAKVPPGERALAFLRAGGDVAITVDPDVLGAMTSTVRAELARDARLASSVEESVRRVLHAKARQGLLDCV